MGSHPIRRRELLVGGSTLLTAFSGCAATNNPFTPPQSTEPPIIEVTVINRDFESYELYLLIQTGSGEIHSWNTYELPAATESEGIKTSQSVGVGTGQMCLDRFIVSASIDGGDSWSQIDSQTYVDERNDISENQGAAPEGEITEGELTFYPRLDNIMDGQCSNGTQESDTTTDSAPPDSG